MNTRAEPLLPDPRALRRTSLGLVVLATGIAFGWTIVPMLRPFFYDYLVEDPLAFERNREQLAALWRWHSLLHLAGYTIQAAGIAILFTSRAGGRRVYLALLVLLVVHMTLVGLSLAEPEGLPGYQQLQNISGAWFPVVHYLLLTIVLAGFASLLGARSVRHQLLVTGAALVFFWLAQHHFYFIPDFTELSYGMGDLSLRMVPIAAAFYVLALVNLWANSREMGRQLKEVRVVEGMRE